MRSTVELLELPYSFTRSNLVTGNKFASLAGERDVGLDNWRLESLHRLGLLVPLFRIKRPKEEIRLAVAQRSDDRARALASWTPTRRAGLLEAVDERLLFDPADERFRSQRSFRREIDGHKFDLGVYLYSEYQLAALEVVRRVLPWISWGRRSGSLSPRLKTSAELRTALRDEARLLRDAVIAILALDPVYYPRITGTLSLPVETDLEQFMRWRFSLGPKWLLDWLGEDSDWIRARGRSLLEGAQRLDDLGGWSEVLGAGSTKRWNSLRGKPRLVMDLRLAGELLLCYYDRLIREGLADELPRPPLTRMPYDLRLKRRRPLDALLTAFGLSPHPQLILIVEGRTERLIVPRVMEILGIPTDSDFISVQDAEGVTTNLGPLLAYLAPQPSDEENEHYIHPLRPLTRFLVVLDPEGPVTTQADREERRQMWVDRIMRAMPQEMQSLVVREQIEHLVTIRTWNKRGDSFEFAHFTDLQIARAIDKLDGRTRKPTRDRLVKFVADARAGKKNLDNLLHGFGKVQLADALWTVLERKVGFALERETPTRIPVVSVAEEAVQMAQEYGRGNTVIALEPRPEPSE
jgi:hypothetical protein